jgi:NADH:ubiquinone oxidoreductase subunit E
VFIDFGDFSFFCKYYVEATRFCNGTLCMLMGSVKLWLKNFKETGSNTENINQEGSFSNLATKGECTRLPD